MIVGNGLLANEFHKYKEKYEDYCIFASGVSYSTCISEVEFDRELNLLKEQVSCAKKLVYFSSENVLSNSDSEYSQHKLNMENFIKNNFHDYLIIRLPNVIGRGGHKKTLFNVLYEKLLSKDKITLYENALRFIIDVSDVEFFTKIILEKNNVKICNMTFDKPVKVVKIFNTFEKVFNIKFNKSIGTEARRLHRINNNYFQNLLSEVGYDYDEDIYLEKVITKYYLDQDFRGQVNQ
ncbi:hypothetical protein PGH07_09460 [Sulfurovum sp. zt1-1]|uniref:NAD-dependent epimerase/dehydratase domain-containing protein n=1 Tax=Sulfurovum zhangzhouensis TaxID=3019067 RepID=A0ABT7QZX5_9BACT|nr:hypothetical protein [Sulfurovum zhangzhouensis]MDM5272405.1 hypothetical protein [Sulfurovum zhangzhouensis]